MVSGILSSQNKMLLCQKITDKYSYCSKQVECIYPPLASLKINAFHPQATLVQGLKQCAISNFFFSFGFYISKCDVVLNLDLLPIVSTSSKSINMGTPAFLICIYFKQFSLQSKKLMKDLRLFPDLFALEFYFLISILVAEMLSNVKLSGIFLF